MLPIYFAMPNRTPLKAADIWPLTYLGFLGVILNQGLFTVGLNFTTSDHSAVIIAIGPVIVLLLARALKLEVFTAGKILGMAISFVGVFLLETENGSPANSPFLLGDAITFFGVIGFAAYAVLGKRIVAKYDAIAMNTFNLVASAILLAPLTIRQSLHLSWKAVTVSGWLGMIYMALGSSIGAYTIFYWLLRYMSASRVAVLSYFQPAELPSPRAATRPNSDAPHHAPIALKMLEITTYPCPAVPTKLNRIARVICFGDIP